MIYSLFCFQIDNIFFKMIFLAFIFTLYNSHIVLYIYIFPENSYFGGYGKKNRRNMSVWFSDLSINHKSLFLFLPLYLVKYAYSHTSSGNPAF